MIKEGLTIGEEYKADIKITEGDDLDEFNK